ncbi:SubName: Full=Uncharacterized protein {ECO:0000313/EMBL:CCA66337.1} [Serendipita indica DSM 11827]|uniref:Uncharacterized protein n=1 Tax=Serendipita indica (strain DSM 11827) TaxID=1109443 RepID=G4T4U2_SERID|nr:SubName: Full=Uncharacterized protein {ECO:0000313/EMBL:CCA66337.1} [Serendipita indica DSM 11827]CCA66337.1 hypothetical protein PIIN_00023 [Serendipita indica DSM 11827]
MASQSAPSASHALPEALVINGFHLFLINSLSQAKLEKLIDEDTLASAETDVMISGPALCLFFAALRSQTTPPSVPIPGAPVVLSIETCPPIFQSFFQLWSRCVPEIQALPSNSQHDLARVICDLEPLTPNPQVTRIAADIRSVAIEITQRRTFQERYRSDLQSALDVGQPAGGEKRRVAAFSPPPSYEETSSQHSHSPHSSVHSSPQRAPVPLPSTPSRLNAALPPTPHAPGGSEGMASIESTISHPQDTTHLTVGTNAASSTTSAATSSSRSRSPSPTLIPPDSPAINLIRETLYAALGEVIASTPGIVPLMKTDPARAYFSAVGLSILTVSTDCITVDGGVITPIGKVLTLAECPVAYRPLMSELGRIGAQAKTIIEEDNDRTIAAVRAGEVPPQPRMERVRRMLEHGVAREEARYDEEGAAGANPPAPVSSRPLVSSPPVFSPPAHAPPMPVPTIPNASGHSVPIVTSPPPQAGPRSSLEQDPYLAAPNAGASSTTSSPRSSGEHSRGLRNVLHKTRPATAPSSTPPPPVAPKPTPPSLRPPTSEQGPGSLSPIPSPARYSAPTTPPPGRESSGDSAVTVNIAGIGARPANITTNSASGVPAPTAAMMAHQPSLSASGNPYDQAMGSGARINAGHGNGTPHALASGMSNGGNGQQRPPPTPVQQPPIGGQQQDPNVPVAGGSVTREPSARRSLEGTTVQFANRINGLALALTRLRMFQERQDMVFSILASVHD